MLLYKYRGLGNLRHALDIFVKSRMHAAVFTKLNDPMEGIYTYDPDKFNRQDVESIWDSKNSYRILSLSETPNNMLMWSYYAAAHTGMVVGVIVNPEAIVEPVRYVDHLAIDTQHQDVARGILIKKLKLWEHEKEQRAFIRNENFIRVEVRELIFGLNTNGETKTLVTQVAEKFCPNVIVRTIERGEIDTGTRGGIDA